MINVKGLTAAYGRMPAIENITFDAQNGDFICIAGRNGSGKSTLLKAMLGLIPISGGSVNLNGCRAGYLPQHIFMQSDFPSTVLEIALSGLHGKNGPFGGRANAESAMRNLELMNISNLAKKPFRALSGGQKQRVLIARAIGSANGLLMLDEPASGLDKLSAEQLYTVLTQVNTRDNITVLMTTHDVAAAPHSAKILHIERTLRYFGGMEGYIGSGLFAQDLGGCEC